MNVSPNQPPKQVIRYTTDRPYSFETPQKDGDVGYDLHINIRWQEMNAIERLWFNIVDAFRVARPFKIVWPWSTVTLHSGIRIELPNNLWAKIEARSSTSKKKLIVLGGIIDSGYRGEYFTILGNFSMIPRIIKNGERYAQVIFYPAIRPVVTYSHHIKDSARGASGFGSTGA